MNRCFLFPTYNESETIAHTIGDLVDRLDPNDFIIIADDSTTEERLKIKKYLETLSKNVIFLPGEEKGGRGAAVHRGLQWIVNEKLRITHVIQADCDGSHRVEDILKISNADEQIDVLIGSRYLPESQIKGWSLSRRLLSKVLNKVIPMMIDANVSDITNGLRRYSTSAIHLIVQHTPISKGFIFLSEEVLILKKNRVSIEEVPIIFEPRFAGSSSVTLSDLAKSLIGLAKIFYLRKNIKI